MRHLLKTLVAAGVLAAVSGTASAQGFNVQFGVRDRDRTDTVVERRIRRDREIEIEDRRPRRGVVEERIIRRGGPPRRTVCRREIRERVTPGGVVIRRPTEVCRTVVGGRRFD
jgi:hypothetical protein